MFLSRSVITEYGRVVVSTAIARSSTSYDKRWLRVLTRMRDSVDGNPALPENGGVEGLARHHCLGSFANHSSEDRNTVYHNMDSIESNLLCPEIQYYNSGMIILLRAVSEINRHHQIHTVYSEHDTDLTKIVPNEITFQNETISAFFKGAVTDVIFATRLARRSRPK